MDLLTASRLRDLSYSVEPEKAHQITTRIKYHLRRTTCYMNTSSLKQQINNDIQYVASSPFHATQIMICDHAGRPAVCQTGIGRQSYTLTM